MKRNKQQKNIKIFLGYDCISFVLTLISALAQLQCNHFTRHVDLLIFILILTKFLTYLWRNSLDF